MKNFTHRTSSRGIAVLEATAATLILFTLLTGVFGIVELIQENTFVDSMVELELLESDVKPLKAEYVDGSFKVSVNYEKLNNLLSDTLARTDDRYLAHYLNQSRTPERYIEVTFGIQEIDQTTGVPVNSVNMSPSKVIGSLGFVPGSTEHNTRLSPLISEAASKLDGSGKSIWATPLSISLENEQLVQKYVSAICFVGIRVFVEPDFGLARFLLGVLGMDRVYHQVRVFTLRGDVEL